MPEYYHKVIFDGDLWTKKAAEEWLEKVFIEISTPGRKYKGDIVFNISKKPKNLKYYKTIDTNEGAKIIISVV